MKAVLLRIGIFAAIVACAYALLWTPFRAGYGPPVRLGDFILCVAIQTFVPLLVWIAVPMRRVGRGMQTVIAMFWTWLASSALVLLAERFQDSSYPWDYLFYEGGMMVYLPLVVPVFAIIAAALTIIPFAGETYP